MSEKKEMVLVEDRDIRESVIDRVEVLEKVKELILLPSTDYATTEQVAEYYEVGLEAVKTILSRHRDELETDGIKLLTGKETKEFLVSCNMNLTNFRGYFMMGDHRFANRSNVFFPKRAILRVGMLLRDSNIAKEVRTRLLDIIHDAEQQAPDIINGVVSEMTEEQQLVLEKVNAEISGDWDRVSYINAKLFALKNKRIAELETENTHIKTHALTIIESKAVINRIVRTIAMREYGSMFASAYSDLYSKVNYILGINVRSRNKKKSESLLDTLTEEEMFEVEKITRAWAVEAGLDLDDLLKIA